MSDPELGDPAVSGSMNEPRWFSTTEALAVHRAQIARFGGADGIRDPGLLESALTRPQNLWHYGDPPPDWAALAACYAFGIIKNHPFVDGNKRVGYVLCRIFLLKNGYDFAASATEKYEAFYGVAAGERSEEELAVWIRGRLVEAT